MKKEPLYLKIYNSIYDDIQNGKYLTGDKLPSEKEIASQFKVSRITCKNALNMLNEEGLIKRIPGKGTFVTSNKKTIKDKEIVLGKKVIGLIISDYTEGYGLELVGSIEKEVLAQGYVLIQSRTHGNQELENEMIDLLINLGVSGLLIMPVHGEHYNPKILRVVLDGFPVVFIDRNLKGISTSFVGTDNVDAAKRATDYLLELGHRHISFISHPKQDTSSTEDRISGIIKSHAEYGVVPDQSIWLSSLTSTMPGHESEENAKKDIGQIEDLIKNNPQITCIFASEYNLALYAKEAICNCGMKTPDDISVLCFDSPRNFFNKHAFTHIHQKEQEIGTTAVQLLLEQFTKGKTYRKVYLGSELVVGRSTREIDS